jgi:hypothetical protein
MGQRVTADERDDAVRGALARGVPPRSHDLATATGIPRGLALLSLWRIQRHQCRQSWGAMHYFGGMAYQHSCRLKPGHDGAHECECGQSYWLAST